MRNGNQRFRLTVEGNIGGVMAAARGRCGEARHGREPAGAAINRGEHSSCL